MGTLMRKIHRQVAYWANRPPRVGDRIAEIPQTLDKYPWMRPRSFTEYKSPARVCTVAPMAPAPRPWMPRKMMRVSMFHEAADSTDPSRKITDPRMRIGFRPYTSANLL